MSSSDKTLRQLDTKLDLDNADLERSEVHEILTWIYHYDEICALATSPFRGSMMCAWNSMILPENLIVGVLMVHHNVSREQSLEFLTSHAKEIFVKFGTDNVQQRVKSLRWVKRIYSHRPEGYQSLRGVVTTALRPFRNEIVELEEGRMLMDSSKDFELDMEQDINRAGSFA